MIGVSVQPSEQEAARELFELCKTPWEFYRDKGQYQLVICTAEPPRHESIQLTLIYSAERIAFDAVSGIPVNSRTHSATISHAGKRFPVYGAVATFPTATSDLVRDEATRESVLFSQRTDKITVVRIGYNLFEEIRFLLSEGQPIANADQPTLELHLALLRDLITRAGLPFVEIPPVPEGHAFIACLTHDIDNPRLRNHFCDHTMFGFLYRASIGSVIDACRGRLPLRRAWENWSAAIRLPLIYLGVAKDIWRQFDRYLEIEKGLNSTYFVIPRGGYHGHKMDGTVEVRRASRYELAEVVPELERIISAGNEVGLHGLDAWVDAAAAREEKNRVTQTFKISEIGVRMHWLYFDGNTPVLLDRAGFTYDSSVGYNETVGYRAGTAQIYRPLGAKKLLELPLIVMDTALFFPNFLNLREDEAYQKVFSFLDDAMESGGAVTINWHDRSIAPERQWGDFYEKLIRELKRRGAWFATAARAVAWFQMRRLAVLECSFFASGEIRVQARSTTLDSTLPGLKIRVHKPHLLAPGETFSLRPDEGFTDRPFNDLIDTLIKP